MPLIKILTQDELHETMEQGRFTSEEKKKWSTLKHGEK